MKRSLKSRIISAVLTCTMLLTTPIGSVKAAAEDTGKYISEVYIAYGSTEDEANSWLTSHGWEPVEGNFNAGKGDSVAAVMGVRRTNDPNDAVTDMAVMNMGTDGYMGYSFDDYQALLQERKADIDEFLDSFTPVLEEYRGNYNGRGSESGRERAKLAHDLLNMFYDGEVDGQYAVNDTGTPLGDLLLNETKRELTENAYNAMPKNKRLKYADLQQIVLESSGPALLAVEQALTLAADVSEDTWLDRLGDMSSLSPKDLAEIYADGNSSLSDSAALNLLRSKYGDAAKELANGYDAIAQEMRWYEAYKDQYGLRQGDEESDEDFQKRLDTYFEDLKAKDRLHYDTVSDRFLDAALMYGILNNVEYESDQGSTLYEFFCPEDTGAVSSDDTDAFLPMAIALSDGQRAGLHFVSLYSLLLAGSTDAGSVKEAMPEISGMIGEHGAISIYSGINRAIFRNGVALTSAAMMEKSRGKSPYDQMWDQTGLVAICSYAVFALSTISLVGGYAIQRSMTNLEAVTDTLATVKKGRIQELITDAKAFTDEEGEVTYLIESTSQKRNQMAATSSVSTAGKWIMGIGGVLMLAAAAMKGYQIYKYYNRTFTVIPSYIVDEADIVSYTTDKNGNEVKNIDFDQFVYYEVVKCNRQDIGVNSKAQDGVDQYAEWGCGDAADLNCDIGKQWLALYTVKSSAKGNPILADSLKLQTGSDAMPSGCTAPLHFFTYTYAADLGDEAYAYDNNMNGVYFFWDTDSNAYTVSSFTTGQLALAGIGGLAVGILGATVVMLSTKKRKETPEAQAVA